MIKRKSHYRHTYVHENGSIEILKLSLKKSFEDINKDLEKNRKRILNISQMFILNQNEKFKKNKRSAEETFSIQREKKIMLLNYLELRKC